MKKLSDMLVAIVDLTPDGAVLFYGQLKPDPWQAANNELERTWEAFATDGDTQKLSLAFDSLLIRFKNLVSAYRLIETNGSAHIAQEAGFWDGLRASSPSERTET